MSWREFSDKYPALSPTLASSFHDSADAFDDDSLARNLDKDLAVDDRIQLLSEYLADAQRLMVNIESDWEIMIAKANRQIYNVADARDWLLIITVAWQEELARLQGGGSKPI